MYVGLKVEFEKLLLRAEKKSLAADNQGDQIGQIFAI
jgi:hypothetical protein